MKPANAIFIRVDAQSRMNQAQNFWLWEGLELLGCCAAPKRQIQIGVMYIVEKIENERIFLNRGDYSGRNGSFELSLQQLKKHMRLSFAQTYASCQGTEFASTLTLHDTDSPYFTRKHLFVGLSRAKASSAVHVT